VTPQDRETAISALAKVLLAKTTGHTEAEAREVAAQMIDQAARDRETGGHGS
jgi:hypothetical protein